MKTINEAQLREIVAESVRRALKEIDEGFFKPEKDNYGVEKPSTLRNIATLGKANKEYYKKRSDARKKKQAEDDAEWDRKMAKRRESYGSSDPLTPKGAGWRGNTYYDAVGVKDNSDIAKDWMYGDR